MKRVLLMLILVIVASGLWAGNMMSVKVESTRLMPRPSFGGAPIAQLSYTDQVEVLDDSRGWNQVRTGDGETGWVHGSALSRKEIVYSSSGNVSSGASSEEVALAGKGFNPEVEAQYKADTDLDFSWVDTIAAWDIQIEDLIGFLEDGDLAGVVE